MRVLLVATILSALLAPFSANAQFKGYFDTSHVQVAELAEPDWGRRQDGDRLLYLCVNTERCVPPTGVEIKGIVRAEALPAAFEGEGPLSPARLAAQGKANAQRTGARFLVAEPLAIAGVHGVHMEASAELGRTVYFVTRWLGQGNRMLDVKVTTPDLELARQLVEQVTRSSVSQVFKAAN
jgi:hypothetical protein